MHLPQTNFQDFPPLGNQVPIPGRHCSILPRVIVIAPRYAIWPPKKTGGFAPRQIKPSSIEGAQGLAHRFVSLPASTSICPVCLLYPAASHSTRLARLLSALLADSQPRYPVTSPRQHLESRASPPEEPPPQACSGSLDIQEPFVLVLLLPVRSAAAPEEHAGIANAVASARLQPLLHALGASCTQQVTTEAHRIAPLRARPTAATTAHHGLATQPRVLESARGMSQGLPQRV